MSEQIRPKDTRMTVCDLCDKEIPDREPDESGSLTNGWIAHNVVVGERPSGWRRTLHAWLHYPPASRVRRSSYQQRKADPANFRERRYDFHADCILRLVEGAIAERQAAVVAGTEEA